MAGGVPKVWVAAAGVGVVKGRAGVGGKTVCPAGGGSAVSSTNGVDMRSTVGKADEVSEEVGSAGGVGRARGSRSGGKTRVGATPDWAGFKTTTRVARMLPGWRTPLTRTCAPTATAPRDWSTRVLEDRVTRVLPTIQPDEVMRSTTPETVTGRGLDEVGACVGRLTKVGLAGADVGSAFSAVA